MQDTENWTVLDASRHNFQQRKKDEQSRILAEFAGQALTWKVRYDRMKKYYGWNDAAVAEITGNTAKSINTVVNSENFPRWLRLAIYVFEMETGINKGATVNL